MASSPLLEKRIIVSDVTLDSPELTVTKSRAGKLNVTSLGGGGKDRKEEKKNPVTVDLGSIVISGGTVRYTDLSRESPLSLVLGEVTAKAGGLSTRQGARGRVDFSSRLNGNCALAAVADMGLRPFVCDARVDIEGLEPVWFQPYFTDTLRIYVTRGRISSKARFIAERNGQNPLRRASTGTSAWRTSPRRNRPLPTTS
jgi:hypothetical protein